MVWEERTADVVIPLARQTPLGARPNRKAIALLALLLGRLLDVLGDKCTRLMITTYRTQLIG